MRFASSLSMMVTARPLAVGLSRPRAREGSFVPSLCKTWTGAFLENRDRRRAGSSLLPPIAFFARHTPCNWRGPDRREKGL